MALGSQNRPQMNPAQFVSAADISRLVDPRDYSRPNFSATAFQPDDAMRLTQQAMENQTSLNNAQQAYYEAQPWNTVNNVLDVMEKSQPDIQRMQMLEAVQVNALMNQELQTINSLYEKAYKGDMSAQEALANFTFNKAILEKVPVEKYGQLKEALSKAQLSVTNSGMVSAMNKVKLGLKTMVENLVGDNNPEAATLAGVISRAVSQSGEGGIQPELLEEIQNRVKVYKLNNPKSKALDLGIVDTFRQDMDRERKQMREAQLYGDQNITPRDASALIGNLSKLIDSDTTMTDDEKMYYRGVIQSLLSRAVPYGQLSAGIPSPAGQTTNTQGKAPGAVERFSEAWNKFKGQ